MLWVGSSPKEGTGNCRSVNVRLEVSAVGPGPGDPTEVTRDAGGVGGGPDLEVTFASADATPTPRNDFSERGRLVGVYRRVRSC
eukprot:702269-Hanusia_phi.AAC.5